MFYIAPKGKKKPSVLANIYIKELMSCENTKQRRSVLKKIANKELQEETLKHIDFIDEQAAKDYINLIRQLPSINQKKERLFKAPDYLQERIMKEVFLDFKPRRDEDVTSERECA